MKNDNSKAKKVKQLTIEDKIYRNNEDFLQSEVDDELVVMNVHNGAYYGLNKVTLRIWELCNQKIVIADLIKNLLDEYEVDEETCRLETMSCIIGFAKNRLITVEFANEN